MNEPALAAWKLPLIVASIAIPIVGGFYLGGPGLGMAVGALAATAILVMAIRNPPLHPIRPPAARDFRRHILVVLANPLEEGRAIEALLAATSPTEGDPAEPEILLLAPSPHRFLARWTSDSGPGRERAQHSLVLSAASLAKAGIAASARVGDEDLRQSTEDELRSFPATEVILATGPRGEDTALEAVAADLESRLLVPCRRLCAGEERVRVRIRGRATRTSHDARRGFAGQRSRQGSQRHPTS
ncbi:MAG: hypothetical protein ACRDLL_04220 [Solirubrobacterales bacterium]